MQRSENIKFFIFILVIISIFIFVDRYGVFNEQNLELWRQAILDLGPLAPVGFILLYIIGTMLFLPGTIFTILGGIAFGVFWGTVFGVIGASIGAVAAHWTARILGKETVDRIVTKRIPKAQSYNDQIEKNGFLTVLILRITPLIPYNGLNFALAYSPVRIADYFWATFFGVIPGVLAYVYLGEAVASLSPENILFAVVGIFGYIALTALLAKKIKNG